MARSGEYISKSNFVKYTNLVEFKQSLVYEEESYQGRKDILRELGKVFYQNRTLKSNQINLNQIKLNLIQSNQIKSNQIKDKEKESECKCMVN